ncbi:hypothetical protein POVWA2_032860 [Plasmodium ovale wallikeri]|uniref:Uncharacterized protein n=1 Tax=Plasmodium ovale wallikeri TaxID=864142 RepID=A0A1A8YYP8_PLAOA|nr:hypothetical protein POVWA1_033240 [Plasmodium ovale wallikeri]SBT37029.1 hypothetical protein POVWA2_032860 [Plasmodium ovale wallikeri]
MYTLIPRGKTSCERYVYSFPFCLPFLRVAADQHHCPLCLAFHFPFRFPRENFATLKKISVETNFERHTGRGVGKMWSF